MMICGIDEAGRGPAIGPMVVAGVKVNDDGKLIEMGVKDSKMLSAKRREELEDKIKKCSEFTIKRISASDIDELRKSNSLNKIEANFFAEIVDELCEVDDVCYMDSASTDEDKYGAKVKDQVSSEVEIISKHEADLDYPVVSAASIIAKVERDRQIEKISEEIGKNIGSGYPSDQRTRQFLKEWISNNDSLPPHSRKSWKTCKTLLNRHQTCSLDQF